MRLKSYFSATVEAAMATARQELGPEAMLINSRPAAREARHLGNYEVIFATELPAPPPASGASDSNSVAGDSPVRSDGFNQLTGERWSREIADLKKEIEGMRSVLRRSAFAQPYGGHHVSRSFADAYAALLASEISPELAQEIVECAQAGLGVARGAANRPAIEAKAHSLDGEFGQLLEREIESRFRVEPLLGKGNAAPRMAALVGPPGAGKTTTLVKLAVNYGLVCRKPVLLLSMDNHRVAAAEQLRSYAAILGVGFQALETVGALAQSIEENRGKDLILIDTPGLGPAQIGDSMGLAPFLSTRADIDVHLVLAASMKPADVTRMVDAFSAVRPQRLLFTKLDETSSYGPIFNEAVRTAMPLSFFGCGQRIPEDLEAASSARLIDLLLEHHADPRRTAA